MENDSRLNQFFSRLGEKLNDQVWFQQLKAKWDELEPQSKMIAQFVSAGITVLLVLVFVGGLLASARRLRLEVAEKSALLASLQSSNEELRRLRDAGLGGASSSGATTDTPGAWNGFFESTATGAGIEKERLTVDSGKPGTDGTLAKETLYELSVKGVNIKQLVRYAFQLENAGKPVKLRHLAVETKGDMSGYLDATLSVSAFTAKE